MRPFNNINPDDTFFEEVRIADIVKETDEAKSFILEPSKPLKYIPGQFLTFSFPTHSGSERRSYSISSAPYEPLAITVKRIPNGVFSRPLIDQAKKGDQLLIAGGAAGFFTIPQERTTATTLFFFAAGSGITPIFSLIKSCLRERPDWSLVLIYSNRSPSQTIFREKLLQLQKSHDHLHIEWLYSNNQDLMHARLNKLVLSNLLSRLLPRGKNLPFFYLCGPFDYMRMIAIVLQSAGVPPDHIRREIFILEKPFSLELPSDTNPHEVTIHIRGKTYSLSVQYPETILQAAQRNGIELPYSCEAGRCGSCVAGCTSGKVWMKYNEVLTDKEIENGRALICNAYPVGGDAVIEYDS